MGDVLEYLVDGTSGIAPGGVEGTCIVAGVCSLGQVGKGYLLGKRSDLAGLLGVGPLVDRLRDVFSTAGQEPVVIAVPVDGLPGGYISPVRHTGTGPDALASGASAANADVVVKIVEGGALGTATYQLSTDGGGTYGSATATPGNGQISIGESGATLTLGSDVQVASDQYEFVVRTAIGPVLKTGTGPDIAVSGEPKAASDVVLRIIKAGGRNVGTYQLSLDGGDSFSAIRTLPVDGAIPVGSTGAVITWPAQDGVAGTEYSFQLHAPAPSVTAVLEALETPLSLYDVEFVHVVGPSDSVDWAAFGVAADGLWNRHRPTFFLCEFRLPYDDEDMNDWAAAVVAERQEFAHRFVACCTAFGEVTDSTGQRITRNWAGLLAGRIVAIPVMRAPGRVLDGGISQGTLPEGWTEAVQQQLETNGYVTARTYAGMRSPYWGDERTLAEDTSDFQFLTVLRTVFKAVRKMRLAALKSMYDEAGDPLLEGDASGLAFLRANLETALNTMVAAKPTELAGYVVDIPSGQDIVNNGVAVDTTLIGIPIIRQIKLFARYVYAGSSFDPRLA